VDCSGLSELRAWKPIQRLKREKMPITTMTASVVQDKLMLDICVFCSVTIITY
jgi:hypothetical protein